MTHVSKRKISEKTWNKIVNQFSLIVSNLSGQAKVNSFVDEFLTSTERVMFAKRLAIIFMLSENIPFSVIEKQLKVSGDTVSRMAKILDGGGYKSITKEVQKEKNKEEFWKAIENFFDAGLPKRGRGRWKNLYKLSDKNFKINNYD